MCVFRYDIYLYTYSTHYLQRKHCILHTDIFLTLTQVRCAQVLCPESSPRPSGGKASCGGAEASEAYGVHVYRDVISVSQIFVQPEL